MTQRPTLRVRAGALLIRVATRLAVHGLRLVDAPMLVVRTPEWAREQDAAQQRIRDAFMQALERPMSGCDCPRCQADRAAAVARAN